MTRLVTIHLLILLGLISPALALAAPFGYVPNGAGVSTFSVNESSGRLLPTGSFADVPGSVALKVDSDHSRIYVLSSSSTSIFTLNIDLATGTLSQTLNPVSVSNGYSGGNSSSSMSNFLAQDPNKKFLFVGKQYSSSYGGSSSIDSFSIDSVSGLPQYVATTSVIDYPGGFAGFAFDPTGNYLYLTHPSYGRSFVLSIDPASGQTTVVQQVGNPVDVHSPPSRIAIHPGGYYAYTTHPLGCSSCGNGGGHVGVYSVSNITGQLTPIAGMDVGFRPNSIAIDPRGNFVLVADSQTNQIFSFSINQSTGLLTQVGSPISTGTTPQHIYFDRSGRFAYVTNTGSNNIYVYAFNQETGLLTLVQAQISMGSVMFDGFTNSLPSSTAVSLTDLTVSCPATLANSSASAVCTASATYSDGSIRSVTPAWSSNNGDVIISTAGALTRSGATDGSATITGTYTDIGVTQTATTNIVLVASAILTSSFTLNSTTGTTPFTARFSNGSISSLQSDILTYQWDFGDGQTSTDANPSHTYTTAGTYTATLSVSNTTGQSSTATQTITVTDPVQTSIPVTGRARLRPQIIMGGFDPILIDLNDSSFKLMAVVRPGAAPIQSVQTRSNAGGISQAMTYAGTFDNGDQLYETMFTFQRGTFPANTLLGDLFGSATTQFRMSVTDTAQQTHSFPDMEFGNHVALNGQISSPGTLVSSAPGTARYSPQVLSAGFDPQLIDLVDDSFDVVAIVRPGSNPIRRVGITQNQSNFAMAMTLDATLPNGDKRYKMTYLYVRGAFPAMRASDLFGTQSGQFNIMVADEAGDIQHFPNLRWGNYPAR